MPLCRSAAAISKPPAPTLAVNDAAITLPPGAARDSAAASRANNRSSSSPSQSKSHGRCGYGRGSKVLNRGCGKPFQSVEIFDEHDAPVSFDEDPDELRQKLIERGVPASLL